MYNDQPSTLNCTVQGYPPPPPDAELPADFKFPKAGGARSGGMGVEVVGLGLRCFWVQGLVWRVLGLEGLWV